MRVLAICATGVILLSLLTLSGAESPPSSPGQKPDTKKAAKPANPQPAAGPALAGDVRRHLLEKLSSAVHFRGFDDPKTTLTEALESLSIAHGITFDVNDTAFRYEQVGDVGKIEIAQPPIPPLSTALAGVIRKILSRIPVPSGATFLLRRDRIEITTGQFSRREIWGRREEGPFLPVVQVILEKRSVQEALKELALQADYNILLDSSIEQDKTPALSAELYNVSLDNAVRLLARMANLAVVQQENVLFVTTPERAAALPKEQPGKGHSRDRPAEWILNGGTGLRIPLPPDE